MAWMYWTTFILLLAITVTRWIEGPWWFLTLDALRLHWGYAALVLSTITLVDKRWLMAGCFLFLAIISFIIIFDGLEKTPPVETANSKTYKIFQSNLLYKNANVDRFLSVLETEKPDIVILLEFTKNWRKPVLNNPWIKQEYPHVLTNDQTLEHLSQLGILSRYPLTEIELQNLQHGADNWIMKARAQINERQSLEITTVHPYHPTNWWQTKQQTIFFNYLATTEAINKNPYRIMAGDFNAPHWFKRFIHMKQSAQLKEFSPSGKSFLNTWPNSVPSFLRLPIDHFLFSQHIGIVNQKLGPDIGSDHYPIVTTITLF